MPEELLWIEGHYNAIHKLNCLIEAPSLNTPILEKPFVIHCDASSTDIKACLSHKKEGGFNQTSYASLKLSKTQ